MNIPNLKDIIIKLREMTGSGVALCKKAIETSEGCLESAVNWLREQGHAQAAKVADRATGEGLISLAFDDKKGVLVELGCETDYVANNEEFGKLAHELADTALKNGISTAAELNQHAAEAITAVIAKIKENMVVKNVILLEGEHIVGYVYRTVANNVPDIGKKGCLIAYKASEVKAQTKSLVREIAMHIIAHETKHLTGPDIPSEFIKKEQDIMRVKMLNEGKKEDMIDKILKGQEASLYKQHALLDQPFFKDPSVSVEQICKKSGVDIVEFKVLSLGE